MMPDETIPPTPKNNPAVVENPPDFPLLKKAEEMMAKVEERQKILDVKEREFSERMKDADRQLATMRIQGKGFAGAEPTREDILDAQAKKMFAPTGINPFAKPRDPFIRE